MVLVIVMIVVVVVVMILVKPLPAGTQYSGGNDVGRMSTSLYPCDCVYVYTYTCEHTFMHA